MAVAESTPIPEADLNRWLTQLHSNDVTLRSDAAHQLGKLGDERAVPALVEALADSDEYVRKSAVTALRRIGGPAGVGGVRPALAGPAGQGVLPAVNGLRDLRGREAGGPPVPLPTPRRRTVEPAATA